MTGDEVLMEFRARNVQLYGENIVGMMIVGHTTGVYLALCRSLRAECTGSNCDQHFMRWFQDIIAADAHEV